MSDELYQQVVADIAALEEQIDELQTRLDELEQLRERVDELDARTDMMQLVEDSDDLDARGRSVRLLQHMQRKADRNGLSRIRLNHEAAVEALHYPDLDRTTIYTDLRRCARLVGDKELCWYESADAGTTDQAALVLDYDQFRAAAAAGSVDPDVVFSTASTEEV